MPLPCPWVGFGVEAGVEAGAGADVGAGVGCGVEAAGAGRDGVGAGVDFGVARCFGVSVVRRLATTRGVAWLRGVARTGVTALVFFFSAFAPGVGVAFAERVGGAAGVGLAWDRRLERFEERFGFAFTVSLTLIGGFAATVAGLAWSLAIAAAIDVSAASFGDEVP
ncbi:MAG: hypothetical protein ABI611_06610 [Solirubrobacteraceae bacterium]